METKENLITQMYTDMYTIVSLCHYGDEYLVKVVRSNKLISTTSFHYENEARDYFKQVVTSHFSMHILYTQRILNRISEGIHIVQHNVLTANNLKDAYNSVCNPNFVDTIRKLKDDLSSLFGTIINWGIEGKHSLDAIEEDE